MTRHTTSVPGKGTRNQRAGAAWPSADQPLGAETLQGIREQAKVEPFDRERELESGGNCEVPLEGT